MFRERIYIFFIATYFAQGMIGIAYEPISYLQKEALGLSAAASATFTAWMSLPFLFKPLLGIVTDALPIAGLRRVPYLLLASAAAAAGWAALASLDGYIYMPTLVLLASVNVGIAFSDVLCDGVMVERGKLLGKTGSYQAAQIATLYLTLLATGLGGGWLAENMSYRGIFLLTAAFPLFIFASALSVPEQQAPARPAGRLIADLGALCAGRSFWCVCLVIFLFSFNPFQGTAMFYYQNDALKFSKLFIGGLTSISGVAGALGAAAFWRYCGSEVSLFGRRVRLDTMTMVRFSVLAGAPLTFGYIAYRGVFAAAAITALMGLASVAMRLSLMDLAAKACPERTEATVFAAFMSVFNLAAWSSNTLGAKVYDALSSGGGAHGAMAALIALSALCTAACWPLLRWIRVETPGRPA